MSPTFGPENIACIGNHRDSRKISLRTGIRVRHSQNQAAPFERGRGCARSGGSPLTLFVDLIVNTVDESREADVENDFGKRSI